MTLRVVFWLKHQQQSNIIIYRTQNMKYMTKKMSGLRSSFRSGGYRRESHATRSSKDLCSRSNVQLPGLMKGLSRQGSTPAVPWTAFPHRRGESSRRKSTPTLRPVGGHQPCGRRLPGESTETINSEFQTIGCFQRKLFR